MRFNSFFVAAMTVAAGVSPFLAAPAIAVAAPSAPIVVTSCSAVTSVASSTIDAVPELVQRGVQITFVNAGALAAKDVEFQVGSGAQTASIVDAGTFAPGVQIRHIFLTDEVGASACRVARAHFANGTAYVDGETLSAAR